jgi:hypothetical protein
MKLDSPTIVAWAARRAVFEIEWTAESRPWLVVAVEEMAESPFDWEPESRRLVVRQRAASWAEARIRPWQNLAPGRKATDPESRCSEVADWRMATGRWTRSPTDCRTCSLDLALVLSIYLNPFFFIYIFCVVVDMLVVRSLVRSFDLNSILAFLYFKKFSLSQD